MERGKRREGQRELYGGKEKESETREGELVRVR